MPTSLSRLTNAPSRAPYGAGADSVCAGLGERRLGQVLLEELLDLRRVRAAVDAIDDTVVDHEHERRDVLDRELLEQARVLVCVHAPDAEPVALLALDVSEEALHAARRSGSRAREEHQHGERSRVHRVVFPGSRADETTLRTSC